MAVKIITKQNFQEVINTDKPVLVDFWASWCGPCMMMSPIVDDIAEENPQYVVGKVNVDDELELAQQFGITSIPTLLVFKNGKLANQKIGVTPKSDIIAMLEE